MVNLGKVEAPSIQAAGEGVGVNNGAKGKGDEKSALQINFSNYTAPFVTLLTTATDRIYRVAYFIRWTLEEIKNGLWKCLSAIYVVFHRLIIPPKFNPESKAFSNSLDRMQEQLPKLQARLLELSVKGFISDYLMLRDLEELRQLNSKINQSYKLLNEYAHGTGRPPAFKIHERVVSIQKDYDLLEKERLNYIQNKKVFVHNKFQSMIKAFVDPGVPLPKDIYRDFSEMLKGLQEELGIDLGDPLKGQLESMRKLSDGESINVKPSNGKEPLRLKNIGNSCYIDSVIQSLLCVDSIVQSLRQPIERNKFSDEKYGKIVAIQKELLKFVESSREGDEDNLTLTELILMIARGKSDGSSLYKLRQAIFDSGLSPDFVEADLKKQHDVVELMTLLIDSLFFSCCQIKIEEHKTTTAFKELEFIKSVEPEPVFKVELPGPNKTLSQLIELSLADEHLEGPIEFDPKEGTPINKSGVNPYLKAEMQKTDFDKKKRLVDLPPVMVVHLNRYGYDEFGEQCKVTHSVRLPQDGIVDLTKYHDPAQGEPKKALYRIKSYIEHINIYDPSSLNGGHYVNYEEKGGKYYLCDDYDNKLAPKFYKEITKTEFLKNQQPYLVVMERLKPEEVVVAEAEAAKRAEEAAKRAEALKKKAEQEKNKKPV